jgi:hypothetical protein
MENPEEMAGLISERYSPNCRWSIFFYEAQAMRNLIRPDFVEIGHMNPERWRHIARPVRQAGDDGPDYDLSGFLYPEFKENLQAGKQRIISTALRAGGLPGCGHRGHGHAFLFQLRLSRQVQERTAALPPANAVPGILRDGQRGRGAVRRRDASLHQGEPEIFRPDGI